MPTIYDVAQLAGVSHTSVSAVINDKPIRMREETRQRIRDAARTLGYQASRVAQQLSTGKHQTIGLCFAGTGTYIFDSPNTNALFAGVVHCASENGLCLLLAPTKHVYTLEETIAKLPSQGVDGGVVIGPVPLSGESASLISQCTIPLVCIDTHPALGSTSSVDADSFTGMKRGVEHLVSAGHKKMAYVTPTPAYQCLADRMRGFYQAIEDNGLSLMEQMTCVVPLGDVPALVRQVVKMANGPTAVVCAEEETTHCALDEAMRLGLSIPGDLSVLCYDDVPGHPLCQSINIIRNDFFGLGAAAVDTLVKLISGECTAPVTVRLAPELLLRTR